LKKLISSHEKDEIETELKVARLELREAKERLEMRRIYSTVDGIIVQRQLGSGEYVGENPIFSIASVNPLFVEVIAPVAYVGKIRTRMKAIVIPEEPVGGHYSAKVTVVDPVIDAASGTFGVRLELSNNKGQLPAGLKCRVRFGD
jgi:multidrug efflux pump subunit AcrA (membrane-fusion protein)